MRDITPAEVHDRPRVDYRFRVRNDDGAHLVEQRAYYDLDQDGRIARMHVVCAGFRPLQPPPPQDLIGAPMSAGPRRRSNS